MKPITVVYPDGRQYVVNEQKLRLLSFLKERQGEFVSGEALSEALAVRRPTVWRDIQHFKELRYEIESRSKLGHRFLRTPDIVHPLEFAPFLRTQQLGRKVYYYRSCDSTQLRARDLAEDLAPQGTLVITEYQTRGMGRFGRRWFSEFARDLLFTVILRPVVEAAELAVLPLAIALAVREAVQRVTGVNLETMFPNDLLYEGRKVAGILLQSQSRTDKLDYVLAGVGLNVNATEEDFPASIALVATSLRQILGREVSRPQLLAEILNQMEDFLFQVEQGAPEILHRWRLHAAFLGEPVRILLRDGELLEGRALDVTPRGALLVETEDGTRELSSSDMLNIRRLQSVAS